MDVHDAQLQQLIREFDEVVERIKKRLDYLELERSYHYRGRGRRPRQDTESLSDLMDVGLLKPRDFLESVKPPTKTAPTKKARLLNDGQISFNGKKYKTPTPAAQGAGCLWHGSGWKSWGAVRGYGNKRRVIPLYQLRSRYRRYLPLSRILLEMFSDDPYYARSIYKWNKWV